MRASLFCVALVTIATTGCRTKTCVDGTLLVELTRSGAAASATKLEVDVSIAGAAPLTDTIAVAPGSGTGTVEVQLPTYPTGEMVVVTIVAQDDNGHELATGSAPIDQLPSGCDRIDLVLGVLDAGVSVDGSTVDGGETDGGLSACASCQLTAVRPHVANSGDVVLLEGTFMPNTTVDFPGSPGHAVTLLSANRGTVLVPPDTTSGALIVHTGGASLQSEFRRASYQLNLEGLEIYENDYPQAEGAHQMVQLPQAVSLHSQVVSNGWLYVIGGTTNNNSANGAVATVSRFRVQVDGTLGVLDQAQKSLNFARSGHTSLMIGSRIWVMGGSTGENTLTNVEYADTIADGTLGNWTTTGAPSLVVARRQHTATIVGNRIYVIGGFDATGTETGSIEYATIDPNGSLSAFTKVTDNALHSPRAGHATFVTPSQVIVMGGTKQNTQVSVIEGAPIMSDGSLGAFAPLSMTLPTGGSPQAAEQLSGVEVGSMLIAPPFVATTDSTGALMSVQNAIALPNVHGFRTALVRDMLFLTGGYGTAPTTSVERIRMDGNATLGTFSPNAVVALPTDLGIATATVVGESVYVVGKSYVLRAKVNADDTLNAFTSWSGFVLGTPVNQHASGIYSSSGTTLFIVTGGVGSDSKAKQAVQIASVGTDDSLTTVNASGMLVEPRAGHALVATGPFVCALGGTTTGTVECVSGETSTEVTYAGAPLKMSLPRTGLTSGLVPTGTFGQSALVVMGGTTSTPFGAYIAAGLSQSGTTLQATDDFTALTITVPVSLTQHTSVVVGDELYFFGGETASDFNTAGYALNITPSLIDSNAVASAMGPHPATPRQGPMGFRVGNFYYVAGGNNVSGSVTTAEQAPLQ